MESRLAMFVTVVLSALLTLVSAADHGDSYDVITRDVCIIGGGSAGTYAAIRLQDMGKSVVVVEKADHLGGHANTFIDDVTGQPLNVGVQIFHNQSIVAGYFQRLNVPLTASALTQGARVFLDFDTGKAVPGFAPASQIEVGQAIQKYAAIIAANYSYLEAGYFLPDPVPEELLMPFGEFAVKYGIEPMVFLANTIVQNNGEVWKEPTLYIIKALGLSLIQAITTTGFVSTPDVNDLYRSAAKVLGDNVIYNATIVKTDRNCGGEQASVLVSTPSGKKLIKAKRLIMAAPPMIENLKGWDLSDDEKSLFKKLEGFGYYGGVFQHSGLSDNTTITNISPKNPFFVNTQPGCFGLGATKFPGKHLVYYGAPNHQSVPDVQATIVKQINRLSANGNFPAANTNFLFFVDHFPYTVHTSVEEIRRGFYKKLYALQGTEKTFWTGAAWITNDSTMIWIFTEALLANITASL